jgi:GAF domain-containing protein
VERKHSILVEDVHAFSGHIARDAASRSELVVPFIHNGGVLGVLDLDSPVAGRFDIDDQEAMERAASIYLTMSALEELPSVRATSK